ncbi:pentapeptide repeat-containing protein [Campylobacter lari]|nr:pentapeptide repeat-containing protein [Campylobacter lari]
MIEKTLEKILHILEKYSEKTHQNGKNEVDEDKIKDDLSKILKIKKDNIHTPSDIETLKTLKTIRKEQKHIRQINEIIPGDEKWFMICGITIEKKLLFEIIKLSQCNILFNECKVIFNIDEDSYIIKDCLCFYNCVFNRCETKIKNNIFEKSLSFFQCEIENNMLIYNNTFLNHLIFFDCHDKYGKKIKFLSLEKNTFKGCFFVKNCAIKNINLWKNKFENRCYFVDSEFGYERDGDNKAKLNFSNACFEDNAYFNNSKFYSYADFHECEFEKIACFYGVTFDKAPNFSQIILKDNFNALNITLNFTFDDLEKQIKQEHEYFNKNKNEQYQKSLDKFANDFRDSFRVFKNALIKDNNLLEASNFHKYELYCKEIELKENWNNRETKTTARKSSLHLKYFIDSLLLGFYRKLSDHHTDFLKVFNNIVLLVALYSVFLFMGGYEDNLKSYQYSDNSLDNNSSLINAFKDIKNSIIESSFVQEYSLCILIFFCVIGLLMICWDILKNIKKIYEVIKNEICIKEIIFCVLNLVAYFLGLLIVLIYLNIYIPKSQDSLVVLSNIGIFFAFIIFYLWLVYLKSLALRLMFVVVSYIIVIIVLGISISILNPFIGKIFNDEQNFTNPIFVYITFAYTILLILILFSFQKTARKNSIVPS